MLAGAQSVERRGCRADRSCDRDRTPSIYVLHSTVLYMYITYWYARGRMGGDFKPCPKPRPITSPDRPGLPVFQRATLKKLGKGLGTRLP